MNQNGCILQHFVCDQMRSLQRVESEEVGGGEEVVEQLSNMRHGLERRREQLGGTSSHHDSETSSVSCSVTSQQ